MMRRREIIALVGTVAMLPAVAFAQPAGRKYRIGILVPADLEPYAAPFREAMLKLGYAEGKNLQIDFRSAHGNPGLLAGLAAELVKAKVDVLVAYQTPAVQAAKQATTEIPIVMLAGDAVSTGLIASLARPGGNITGMSSTTAALGGKILEILRELLPGANRVAVLANATDPFTKPFLEQVQLAARAMSVETPTFMIRKSEEMADAFDQMTKQRVAAVIVQPSLHRRTAVELAVRHRLPSVSPTALFPEAGGLLSYSSSPKEMHQVVTSYVDRVLKGAKPADLPVQQPTSFDLGINLKTAKALGIVVPKSLLLRANRVIE